MNMIDQLHRKSRRATTRRRRQEIRRAIHHPPGRQKSTCLEAIVFRRCLAGDLVGTLERLLGSRTVFFQHACCLRPRRCRSSLCLLRVSKLGQLLFQLIYLHNEEGGTSTACQWGPSHGVTAGCQHCHTSTTTQLNLKQLRLTLMRI